MIYTFFFENFTISFFLKKLKTFVCLPFPILGEGQKDTKKLSYSMYYWVFRLIGNFFFPESENIEVSY